MQQTLAALQAISIAAEPQEIPTFTDEPKFPSYLFPTPPNGPYRRGMPYGLSIDADQSTAQLKALAEFYERVCLYNAPHNDRLVPWDAARGWLDPSAFADPRVATDPNQAVETRSARYRWMPAVELSSGRETRVPAQAVIPSYPHDDEPARLALIGSSGAALGGKGESGALERAVFEVIERRACRNLDLENLTAERIIDLPADLLPLERTLRRYRLAPRLFRLPGLLEIPCVLVVLADSSGIGPALSIATRAAPTYSQALASAMMEALERRRPARMEQSMVSREDDLERSRIYPWPSLETLRQVQPCLDRISAAPFDSLPSEPVSLDAALSRLRDAEHHVYRVELTLPQVDQAGFEAIRVLIPGLGPLPT